MYKSLLVPVDGSPFAEHALPLALAVARRANAAVRLVLVHVPVAVPYNGTELIYDAALDGALRDREQAYLDHLGQRIAAGPAVAVSSEVVDGAVVDTLQAQAEAAHADLVVMTTHGRGPLTRLWLGSVADHLVRHLPGRLLLVRPTEETVDLAREPEMKRILVPLDGTEFAEQAIEPATRLGTLFGAEYVLARAVQPAPHFAARFAGHSTLEYGADLEARLERLQEDVRTQAEAYLEQTAGLLRRQSLAVQTRVVVGEQPAEALRKLAEALPASLISLKTHGRHGFSRLVLGSVADKVLRGASTPVLL